MGYCLEFRGVEKECLGCTLGLLNQIDYCISQKKAVPLQKFFYNGILLLEKIRIYEECKMDAMRGVLGDDDAISQCTRFNQR